MSDKTRSDIRIGDVSAVDVNEPDRAARAGRPERAAVPPPPAGARQSPSARAPGSRAPLLAGVIALVLLAAAATWLYVDQQRLAVALAAVEAQQRASVASLETQVASTTTTLKSSDSETQKSLNALAADIRRLENGLAGLNRQLDAQGKELGRAATELKSAGEEIRRLAQASGQHDTRLKGIADTLEQHAARQKTLADNLTRLERSGDVAQLRSELAVLSASLREGQQDHERRLKGTEQAIASNDAFRRQVNTTIDRLTQQVSELYQKR